MRKLIIVLVALLLVVPLFILLKNGLQGTHESNSRGQDQDVTDPTTTEHDLDTWRAEATSWLQMRIESTVDSADYYNSQYSRIIVNSHATLQLFIDALKSAESVVDVTGHAFSATNNTLFYIEDKCIGTYQWFDFTTADKKRIRFDFNKEYSDQLYEFENQLMSGGLA